MLRVIIIFVLILFMENSALADSPQIDLGFSSGMNDQQTYMQLKNTEQPKGLFFSWLQPSMPDKLTSFEDQAKLISFFQALPSSVQNNGLWIKMDMGVIRSRNPIDAEHIENLKQAVKQKNILMYLCSPEGKSGVPHGFIWLCSRANPPSNSIKITCEGKSEKGSQAWACTETNR